MAKYKNRIDAEFESIENTLALIPSITELPNLSDLEIAGVATCLHNFYNGVENILKQSLIEKKKNIPTGESWHQELLSEAMKEKIISEDLRKILKPFIAFRHFFCHAYALELEIVKLEVLVSLVPTVYEEFKKEISGTNKP